MTTTTVNQEAQPKEFIVAAAILFGGVISLPPPARHGTILKTMSVNMHINFVVPAQYQGFITSTGRFVNRIEAYQVAYRANQVTAEAAAGPELYSEDLW